MIKGFRAELVSQGYRPSSIETLTTVLANLSRWMSAQGLEPSELTEARVEEFIAARRVAGRRRFTSLRWLGPLLEFLRRKAGVPSPPMSDLTPVDIVLTDYRAWLVRERNLASRTVGRYESTARQFLTERAAAAGGSGVEGLSAGHVTAFLVRECTRVSVGSAKGRAGELRSLLRFLHATGATTTPLGAAVPGVAGWRGARLPAALNATQVTAMLESCDRSGVTGRRDFAVLTLLARLGLRVAEVAGLELDDLDWRRGEVVIRGKGRGESRLPLPVDVGEALAGYLIVRPRVACRHVFLRRRAPLVGIAGGSITSSIVRSACRRAGLPSVGAHRLRHTVATEMLRQGARLPEIGQVLRHRDLATTALYAKVDRHALLLVARRWPGGAA
jgi:site-specific recombinase XerD